MLEKKEKRKKPWLYWSKSCNWRKLAVTSGKCSVAQDCQNHVLNKSVLIVAHGKDATKSSSFQLLNRKLRFPVRRNVAAAQHGTALCLSTSSAQEKGWKRSDEWRCFRTPWQGPARVLDELSRTGSSHQSLTYSHMSAKTVLISAFSQAHTFSSTFGQWNLYSFLFFFSSGEGGGQGEASENQPSNQNLSVMPCFFFFSSTLFFMRRASHLCAASHQCFTLWSISFLAL